VHHGGWVSKAKTIKKCRAREKKQKVFRIFFETPPPIAEEKYAWVRCPSITRKKIKMDRVFTFSQ